MFPNILNIWIHFKALLHYVVSSDFVLDKSHCALPPIRKSRPATYCMSPLSQQHPSTPMIHPNRMMATAIPMKPAVILRKSAKV